MRKSCTYGSVRGASSNGGPYRNTGARSSRCSAARRRGRWSRAQQPAMPVIGFLGPMRRSHELASRISRRAARRSASSRDRTS